MTVPQSDTHRKIKEECFDWWDNDIHMAIYIYLNLPNYCQFVERICFTIPSSLSWPRKKTKKTKLPKRTLEVTCVLERSANKDRKQWRSFSSATPKTIGTSRFTRQQICIHIPQKGRVLQPSTQSIHI